ncbi:hypothetical protein NN561_018607 [Cricetulus griseus]
MLGTFILHVFLLRKTHRNLTSAPRRHTGLTPLAAATSHVFLGPIVSPLLLKTLPWPLETSPAQLQKLEPTGAAVTRNPGKLSPANSADAGRAGGAAGPVGGTRGGRPSPAPRAAILPPSISPGWSPSSQAEARGPAWGPERVAGPTRSTNDKGARGRDRWPPPRTMGGRGRPLAPPTSSAFRVLVEAARGVVLGAHAPAHGATAATSGRSSRPPPQPAPAPPPRARRRFLAAQPPPPRRSSHRLARPLPPRPPLPQPPGRPARRPGPRAAFGSRSAPPDRAWPIPGGPQHPLASRLPAPSCLDEPRHRRPAARPHHPRPRHRPQPGSALARPARLELPRGAGPSADWLQAPRGRGFPSRAECSRVLELGG